MTEGAFFHAQSMAITGGNFTWFSDRQGVRPSDEERNAMEQLCNHISVDASHHSQERAREVDSQLVGDVVRRWTPRLQQDPSHFADSFAVEDVLRDIFAWQRDPPITRFPSMWVNGTKRHQTALIAQVVADILYQRRELSASFFFSQATETLQEVASSVIPSIAFQLAENIAPARSAILQAIINDPTIFSALRVKAQMRKLIIDPLLKASESRPISHSNLILIHALEDCDDQYNFQESFLDAFSQGLELLKPKLPLKLLVLGRHTTHLSDCFAKLAGRSMVLRRPIESGHWLRVEEENYQKELKLKKWQERLENEEGNSGRFREHPMAQRERQEMERKAKDLERREKQLEAKEEELKKKERELVQREQKLKDHISVGDDDTGSGGSRVSHGEPSGQPADYNPITPSKPIPIGGGRVKQVPAETSSPTSYQRNNIRPSTAPSLASIPSMHSDKFPYVGNRMPSSSSIPSPPVATRSATIDRLPSDPPTPQEGGQPQLDPTPHRRYTSDSKLIDRNLMTGLSTKFSPAPMSSALSTSGSSFNFSTGDGESYYSSSPIVEHDPRIIPLQRTDSHGIPSPPPSPELQAAIENPEFTWKTDDDGVVVAGTLEGLVQFLVITIDSQRHKDYRDIFSMACAEVTTPDKLFQIIARRLNDAKDEVRADVRVGQHNAFLVIEHWLKLGYFPSNPNLRWSMKSLCEHAIQSRFEAARLYGVTKLQQLVDQIMGHSTSPSLMGQGGIPSANLEPHSLAIVLSLLEGENYQALRPSDYVLHLTKNMSENVNKFYETNEKIKLWVIESILQYDDVHRRAEVMTYFIKTALECRDMRNLSSAIAIISALYSAAIQGLRVTKKSLTRDKQGKLITLHQLVNSDSDYRGYWDTLKSAPTAEKKDICIPWLKVHLIELRKALSEHPVTIQEEGQHLINLERYTTFMARSKELLHYTPPSFGEDHQGEQFKYLLAQLRTVTFSQGTDQRLLTRSTFLQGQEVSNRRSRKDQMLQLGFQS